MVARNPHAGEPFADDDATVAAALDEVSIPALLCSLVHMTGDPSWIRGDVRPRQSMSTDIQGAISPEDQAEVRAKALPVVLAYRDGGCEPVPLDRDLLHEMMAFVACRPVEGRIAEFMFEDMQFDAADNCAADWGDEIPDEVKRATPVVVIGCGLGGILAGIRLDQAGLPFTIVEKNDGPGGTWWENRYPGARVDVASHQYCYSFEPAHHWSEYYCQQPELRAYFERIVDDYDLRRRCRFGTAVTSIRWDEDAGVWHVALDSGETLDARFVISAVGSLNIPRMPDIPGMDDFAGPSFHSARWPDGLDITGTRFALIGAGASGFQIGPAVADAVEHLTIYQRTAQWMLPNPLYHEPVPEGTKWATRHLPFYGRWMRFQVTYPGIAVGTEGYRIDPDYDDPTGQSVNPGHAQRRDGLLAWLMHHLDDRPDLVDRVVPDYPALGKRVLQDNGTWLRTLKRDDVEIVRTGIERIVADGVVTVDGVHRPADVICFATGFRHNDFLASLEVVGRDGIDLREQWGDEPTAYLGITIPNFPNLFCIYGPGTNLAHSASLFFHSEFQVGYALDAMRTVLRQGAKAIDVRPEVHDDYADRLTTEISQLVWAHPKIAHSHYKNPSGKVFTLSPWPLDLYWEWTKAIDPSDYAIA